MIGKLVIIACFIVHLQRINIMKPNFLKYLLEHIIYYFHYRKGTPIIEKLQLGMLLAKELNKSAENKNILIVIVQLNIMSKIHNTPTLREYLDQLNSIKRVKSLQNLPNSQVSHKAEKSTDELQKQAEDKIVDIRKSLTNKNNIHKEYEILQYIYQLNNIVNHMCEKLRRLQGKTEVNKNIRITTQNNIHKSKDQYLKIVQNQQNVKPQQPKLIKLNELIAPQLLSRQIRFSTDGFSNLGTSTTADLSPTTTNLNKNQNPQQSPLLKQKNTRKGLLKTAKSAESLPIEKQARDMMSSDGSYHIRVSVCQSKNQ